MNPCLNYLFQHFPLKDDSLEVCKDAVMILKLPVAAVNQRGVGSRCINESTVFMGAGGAGGRYLLPLS